MNVTELYAAIDDAQSTVRRADFVADRLAKMLVGRLRHVESCSTLGALKRELAKYNMNTCAWKD